MEPLFLAVICGCHAGLFREALHEIYIPRIQRGNVSFAAKVLGNQKSIRLCFFRSQHQPPSRFAAVIHRLSLRVLRLSATSDE
jgi:hypothetical protein